MPFLEGRGETRIRHMLEHVAGIEQLDRVRRERRECLAIADIVDFGTGDEVQSIPARRARSRSD
jgi:hypothetical protein